MKALDIKYATQDRQNIIKSIGKADIRYEDLIEERFFFQLKANVTQGIY